MADVIIKDLPPLSEEVKIPQFVDVNNLPMGYFDEVSPNMRVETSSINIQKLSQYIKEHNCKIEDITKDEANFFMN